jgi:DNA-binding transcriptional regulator YdaS (Cro superfamily)|tara:strand:+ start:353 stop:586 length:234 start_codon:yes stop_codon:yes gene_type:complete
MQLKKFIRSHQNRSKVKRELADVLGLSSTSSVDQWLAGIRKVPVDHIAGIVSFSDGQIQPVDLRPDVALFHMIGKVA